MSWLESFSNAIKSSIASKLDKKEANAVFAKKTDLFSKEYSDLKNRPIISQVGSSGEYKDLIGKPLSHLQLDSRNTEYLIDQDGHSPILDAANSIVYDGAVYALGYDYDAEDYYVYVIDPNNNEGLFCFRYDTNLIDAGLKHGYDEETGVWYDDPQMFYVYFPYPYREERMVILQNGKAFISSYYEEIDSKHINVLFDEQEWPVDGVVSGIEYAGVEDESGRATDRFVAIVEKPSSGKKLQASAYYSDDFVNWEASDLYIKETTSSYYWDTDVGYKQLITANLKLNPDDTTRKSAFVAWNSSLDGNHSMAYSMDGISWGYVPLEKLPSFTGYIMSYKLGVLFIPAYEKLYYSDDLNNWEPFSEIANPISEPDFAYVDERWDTETYTVDNYLTIIKGFIIVVIKNMKEEVHRLYVPDLGDEYYTPITAFMDYNLKLRIFCDERDDHNRNTGNILFDSLMFGIVTSDVVPEDVTKKVASYIASYINEIPQHPTNDGTYNLKCTVVDGVPTYTWEEVTEYETLEGGDY